MTLMVNWCIGVRFRAEKNGAMMSIDPVEQLLELIVFIASRGLNANPLYSPLKKKAELPCPGACIIWKDLPCTDRKIFRVSMQAMDVSDFSRKMLNG